MRVKRGMIVQHKPAVACCQCYLASIVKGDIGGAAKMVETALARAIPVVIGFLASLLGLGGISEKIKSVIEAIRKPINTAIDWVIHKAVSLVKAAGKFIAGVFGGKKKDPKSKETADPHTMLRLRPVSSQSGRRNASM